MGTDRQGSNQQGLCFEEFGHEAMNQDGDPEENYERVRCEHNCVSGRVIWRVDCRVGQTGCQKASWELSAIVQVAIMTVKEMGIIYIKSSGPDT